jgi:anti-anti-sigma regulatory factor
MLKITRINQSGAATLKLEGQLLQPWISEVISATSSDGASQPALLDLASVTFVDSAGVTLLNDLRRQGFHIVACSPFIAALLHLEKP